MIYYVPVCDECGAEGPDDFDWERSAEAWLRNHWEENHELTVEEERDQWQRTLDRAVGLDTELEEG